jgi:asparagine N-glycosylation enzyme membrane subunit Stt3
MVALESSRTRPRIHALVMALVPLLLAGRLAWAWPRLPVTLAVHFGVNSRPDGTADPVVFSLLAVSALAVPPLIVALTQMTRFQLAFHWAVAVVLVRAFWMVIDFNLRGTPGTISVATILIWGLVAGAMGWLTGRAPSPYS